MTPSVKITAAKRTRAMPVNKDAGDRSFQGSGSGSLGVRCLHGLLALLAAAKGKGKDRGDAWTPRLLRSGDKSSHSPR